MKSREIGSSAKGIPLLQLASTLLKMGCSVTCLKMTPQGCKLVAMDAFDLFVLKVKFSRFPQTL